MVELRNRNKAIVVFFAVGGAAAAANAEVLDGTRWRARDGRHPMARTEVLRFENGTLTSTRRAQEGPLAYEAVRDDERVRWVAGREEPGGGWLRWEGTVAKDGSSMSGFFVHRTAKGEVYITNWTARRGG